MIPPPTPPRLDTDPHGKPGIGEWLLDRVEAARASALAGTAISERIGRLLNRDRGGRSATPARRFTSRGERPGGKAPPEATGLPDPPSPGPAPAPRDIESRADIIELVDAFYTRAMKDEVIGYVFTEVAHLDLEAHLPVMYDFWESMLLGARSYRGSAMKKHIEFDRLTPLTPELFDRWLFIFGSTVRSRFEGEMATTAILLAERVAQSMMLRMPSAAPRSLDDFSVRTRPG